MVDLAPILAAMTGVFGGLAAWLYRQAKQQTRIATRVEWLCNRYAADHDQAVPWDENLRADGGKPSLRDRLTATSEGETPVDGLLSYAGEWHAGAVGLTVGYGAGVVGRPEVAAGVIGVAYGVPALGNAQKLVRQVPVKTLRREPWYAVAGTLVGFGAGVATAGTSVAV